MLITKTKNYNQFPVSELKDHLNIDETDFTYDGQLNRLLKSAIGIAEDYIQDDIVPTTTVLEEESYLTNFVYINYPINTTRIKVISIQVGSGFGTGGTLTTLDPSSYAIEYFNNYTNIRFKGSVSGTRLLINYTSGSATIAEPVKQAVFVKVSELFDGDRSGYVSSSNQYSKAFERILSPYVNALY